MGDKMSLKIAINTVLSTLTTSVIATGRNDLLNLSVWKCIALITNYV